jgi:hypothetical protein
LRSVEHNIHRVFRELWVVDVEGRYVGTLDLGRFKQRLEWEICRGLAVGITE